MYAHILPLRKLPKSIDYFDYKVPLAMEPSIKIGQIVSIPFRKQDIKGLVLSLNETTPFKKVREVASIVEPEPILDEKQMKLAKFVSRYYLVSIATVIKQITPPILKRPRTKKKQALKENHLRIIPSHKDEVDKLTEKITASKKSKFLFHYLIEKDKHALYLNLIKQSFLKNKQIIIIFPEIIDISNFIKYLPLKLRQSLSVINHRLSKSELSHIYSNVKNGESKIIIGTPLAIFSPFKNLGTILIDQEESQNHKQYDQNPRFNAKTVAAELSKITKAKLILSSVAPNIESYYKSFLNEYELIEILPRPKTKIQIINLKSEAKSTELAAISKTLKSEIDNILSKKGRVLLFLNKKGFSRSIICQDCGHTLTCPNCHVPFTLHKENDSSFLFCYRCGLKENIILKCPKCFGINFRDTGLGTEKVEKEAKKLFPRHKIGRFDGEIDRKQDLDKYDILISTHLIFKRVAWRKIDLIGVISADTLLHLPDFRSQEKTYQILTRILSFSEERQGAIMMIQTYSPQNSALKYFPLKYLNFFRSELKLRKEFSYPPFTKLIKLVSQNPSKDLALKEAELIYQKLLPSPVSPPLPAFIFNRFGRYRYQLILKITRNINEETAKKLKAVIPDNWLIDIDPENLL